MPRRMTTDPTPLPRLLIALATALLLVGLRPASAQETEAEGPAEAVAATTGQAARSARPARPTAGGGHGGGGGHSGEANILEPQPTLAIYTLIVFLLLLAVLWRFAWGPLSKALHDREHKLENAFMEAERARTEAAELLEQHRRQMEQVQDEVRKIMDEANRKAQVVYDDRLKQAHGRRRGDGRPRPPRDRRGQGRGPRRDLDEVGRPGRHDRPPGPAPRAERGGPAPPRPVGDRGAPRRGDGREGQLA